MPAKTLDAELNVPCPTCRVKAGQPCRSRRAISLHQARRQALTDLGGQAGRILAATPRKPPLRKPERRTAGFGTTGEESVIPETAEWWPPWEEPPVAGCLALGGMGVTGLYWCPYHKEYEELRVIPA